MSGIEYLWYNRDGSPRTTSFMGEAFQSIADTIQRMADETSGVVEGTATVIDPDVLALPAPPLAKEAE